MNLLETVLNAGGGSVIQQLSKNFNLNSQQTNSTLKALLPMLSQGVKKNISTGEGTQAFLGALSKGSHQRYIDDANTLNAKETISDGNAILGHLFGSKEVSRNAANHVASQTGVDASVIKKMLPIVASVAMGAISKEATRSDILAPDSTQQSHSAPSQPALLLKNFLDSDKDGSVVDDVLDMAKRFF